MDVIRQNGGLKGLWRCDPGCPAEGSRKLLYPSQSPARHGRSLPTLKRSRLTCSLAGRAMLRYRQLESSLLIPVHCSTYLFAHFLLGNNDSSLISLLPVIVWPLIPCPSNLSIVRFSMRPRLAWRPCPAARRLVLLIYSGTEAAASQVSMKALWNFVCN